MLIFEITKYVYGKDEKTKQNIFENDVHPLIMTYSNKTLQYSKLMNIIVLSKLRVSTAT